jgi:hypothetical protein
VAANASSSLSTASSMAPARSWISQPPSSCLSNCRGLSRFTTGGPATNIADTSFTITE